MPRVLVFGPTTKVVVDAIVAAGHIVAHTSLDDDSNDAIDSMLAAFGGRPAEVVLADLRGAVDCLPLRHMRWLLKETWGTGVRLPCLALIEKRHLSLHELHPHADDFILPPHEPSETLARISLLLFRARQVNDASNMRVADLTVDLSSEVAKDESGNALSLTPKEYELLLFLCSHRGKFFDRDRLLTHVWGVDFLGSDRTVDIHICRLRSKLPPGASTLLETRRGVGYGFNTPA